MRHRQMFVRSDPGGQPERHLDERNTEIVSRERIAEQRVGDLEMQQSPGTARMRFDVGRGVGGAGAGIGHEASRDRRVAKCFRMSPTIRIRSRSVRRAYSEPATQPEAVMRWK